MKLKYWVYRLDAFLGGVTMTDGRAQSFRERGYTLVLVSGDGR